MRKFLISIILIMAPGFSGISQSFVQRSLCIMDVTARNGETSQSNFISLQHLVKLAGMPYVVTTDVSVAITYPVVVSTSDFTSSTFSLSEKNIFKSWVSNGGVLVVPNITDTAFFSTFGVNGYNHNFSRYFIKWDTTTHDASMRWINDTNELMMMLGDSIAYPSSVIFSRGYTLSTATSLARFGDGRAAITKNQHGLGCAYAIGLTFRDMVLRNQLNRDYEAQRNYANHFEPGSDVLMLFLRGLYVEHVPFANWKHTAPEDHTSVLIMTHDIDCRQAMDTMYAFASYEQQHQIEATYFITTHYFDDDLDTNYYSGNLPEILAVSALGHKIASHSVGHFPDFDDASVFPQGTAGNTQLNYQPHYSVSLGQTIGGSVFGECEVSKNVLETDIGHAVRSFRGGYLDYPLCLIDVLDSTGYLYNSTYSANDVLTGFPFRTTYDRSFSKPYSGVLEIPLTIDTDYDKDSMSAFNYQIKAARWVNVISKYAANFAPVTILLHPTLMYKLQAEDYIYSNVAATTKFMELGEFGEYWLERDDLCYTTTLTADSNLTVVIPDSIFPPEDELSLVIRHGQHLNNISVRSQNGWNLNYFMTPWEGDDLLITFGDLVTASGSSPQHLPAGTILFQNVPNPATGTSVISFQLDEAAFIDLSLYDGRGQLIRKITSGQFAAGRYATSVSAEDLAPGIYMYVLRSGTVSLSKKMMIVE